MADRYVHDTGINPDFYFDLPEPTSPSVVPERWISQYDSARRHEAINPKLEIAAKILRELGTAEARVKLLEEELIRRNQDIADLQLTNRNLSQKIVETRRMYPRGIHGS